MKIRVLRFASLVLLEKETCTFVMIFMFCSCLVLAIIIARLCTLHACVLACTLVRSLELDLTPFPLCLACFLVLLGHEALYTAVLFYHLPILGKEADRLLSGTVTGGITIAIAIYAGLDERVLRDGFVLHVVGV